MDTINPEEVAARYNAREVIWDKNDKWHSYTRDQIASFTKEMISLIGINQTTKVLNAGSAGFSYGIPEHNILHVDIAEQKIAGLQNSIVGDIHKLNLEGQCFDIILCVGSVLNYCDPVVVIKEFSRLIRDKGFLILEFENSYTFELLGKSLFNRKAALIDSFYNGQNEKIWFFSESHVSEILELNRFAKLKHKRFHILSPLIYRISKNESISAAFSRLDPFLERIPLVQKFSSNIILLLQKSR